MQNIRPLITGYSHPQRVSRDIEAALKSYGGLTPGNDVFGGEEAMNHRLFNLNGTIPVFYRGNTYNIPITIWFLPVYPDRPPIPYVVPTATMVIKPGKHVDQVGKFYHPYLTHWSQRKDSSSVIELLGFMQQIFAEETPVYSRPSPSQPTYTSPQPLYPSPQLLHTSPSQQYQQPYQNNNYYTPSSSLGYSSTLTSTSSSFHNSLASPPQFNGFSNGNPALPLKPALPSRVSVPSENDDQVTLLSLRSAVHEKLNRIINDINAIASSEMDTELEINRQLIDSEATIKSGLRKLEEERNMIMKSIDLLQPTVNELRERLQDAQNRPPVPVDDLVLIPSVVHRQILDAVSEDHAIDDILYYIGKALKSGLIDFQVSFKWIRSLAQDQFMKRALVMKIKSYLNQ